VLRPRRGHAHAATTTAAANCARAHGDGYPVLAKRLEFARKASTESG
jgi:hypothetical protein